MNENETPENPQPAEPSPPGKQPSNPPSADTPEGHPSVAEPSPAPYAGPTGPADVQFTAPAPPAPPAPPAAAAPVPPAPEPVAAPVPPSPPVPLSPPAHSAPVPPGPPVQFLPGQPTPAAPVPPGQPTPAVPPGSSVPPAAPMLAPGSSVPPGAPLPTPGAGQYAHDPALTPGAAAASDSFGPNKGLSKGALFGIIGAGAALILIAAVLVIVPFANRGGSGGGEADGAEGKAPTAATASEFVEAYLTAVSEGDAKAALGYVRTTSKTLLTDEVLKASLELGAIEDIEVGKERKGEGNYDVSVPATFTVGGEKISRDFRVYVSEGDDTMVVVDGLMYVPSIGFETLGLTVNGVEAPDMSDVFPGTYEFAVSAENFTIEGESTLVLADPDDRDGVFEMEPTLNEKGLKTFRELVSASLHECIAMKTLSTPCGLAIVSEEKNGYVPVDGSVVRSITVEGESTLAALEPHLTENSVVTTFDRIATEMVFDGQTAAGDRGQFEIRWGADMLEPKIDFAAEELVVVWE